MPLPHQIRIGTRKSPLAIAQTELFREKLRQVLPEIMVEVIPLITTGDRNADRSLADIGGKALFTKELEEQLLLGTIDIAIHSLKDMETPLPGGLVIAGVLKREDPREVFISPHAANLAELPQGALIGTSSPRRAAQLKLFRSDFVITPLRGNVETRLAKIQKGEAQATLLALAGLKRLHLEHKATAILDTDHFLPAVGQGIIAIECREKDDSVRDIISQLSHKETEIVATAERMLLEVLHGSCRTCIAGLATIQHNTLTLRTMIALPDGSFHLTGEHSGPIEQAEEIGAEAANSLLSRGAAKCII